MPINAALFLPLKNGIRRQFGAVIRDHHAGIASDPGDPVEFPRDADARDRVVRNRCQAFAAEVIDHAQNSEPPTIDEGVRHEVQRPALVRTLRDRHRRLRTQRPLAAAAFAHGEPFFAIEPEQLLVVHLYPLASQQNVQPAIAEPATLRRQLSQTFTDRIVSRPS